MNTGKPGADIALKNEKTKRGPVMRKLLVMAVMCIMIGSVSSAFAQADEQKIKTNPVQSGNIAVNLFDLFGFSGLQSGEFYDGRDFKVLGINDGLLNLIGYQVPLGTEINYFIIGGLAIGGSFHFIKFKSPGGNDYKITIITGGPSLYYYFNINNTILPFITVSYIYSKMEASDDSQKAVFTRIPLGAGCTYMVGRYIGLYVEAKYNFDTFKEDDDPSENGRMADCRIGVKAYF